MKLTPNTITILVALCHRNMHEYMFLTEALWREAEEMKRNRSVISESAGARDSRGPFGLTELLQTNDYRELISLINGVDPEQALRVQQILGEQEYEERLKRLKQQSIRAYFDELRVVSKQELYEAIKHGTVVNALNPDGTPVRIAEDENYSGTFLEQPVATAKLAPEVLAEVLGTFSFSGNGYPYNPQGLRLRQIIISGDEGINLNWLKLPFPLGFQGCDFYKWISADYAEFPWLSFENCVFIPRDHMFYTSSGAFNGSNLKVTHELRFWECSGFGQLFIPDATIGSFVLRGVRSAVDDRAHAEASGQPTEEVRTVIDGATFGTLIVPGDTDDAGSPFSFKTQGTPPSIQQIDGEVTAVCNMLTKQEASQLVWDEFADAFERSGQQDDATSLRVSYQRWKNSQRPWYKRFLFTVFGDWTVRYLHRPSQIWRALAVIFSLTFALALIFHDQLIKSPIANEPIPAGWIQECGSRIAWALMYSLDSTFSPLSIGQVEIMWFSSAWLLLALATLKGLSLICLALFVSSVTTLVSKKTS